AMESGLLAADLIGEAAASGLPSARLGERYGEEITRRYAGRFAAYDVAQRWSSQPWLLNLLARRANAGTFVRRELEALVAETGDPSLGVLVERLIDFESSPDDVDSKIGQSGYVGVTARGPFSPNSAIEDARQRWLFRMVHSARPLQEKMALFWHNHFATAYSKVSGNTTALDGTRAMAAKASETPAGLPGQLEVFRERAVGNFRELLIAMAKDPAMLVWLDG